MSKEYIVKTCKAFRPCWEAMIEANGGHIEGKTIDEFYDFLYYNELIDW